MFLLTTRQTLHCISETANIQTWSILSFDSTRADKYIHACLTVSLIYIREQTKYHNWIQEFNLREIFPSFSQCRSP